ncbi:hypothetical protein V1517DRAFT_333803 [Lipomyces orientalis]|uniref:Uncharacterized protein n=1 Tax=Lipomyces orientalis TaxID=1233043 RepID=A0ACC3TG07_9ASCO
MPEVFCNMLHVYTIGTYTDGVGFSCMTYSTDVQQCDVCRATQTQLASHSPITIISAKDKSHLLQHPEGPYQELRG